MIPTNKSEPKHLKIEGTSHARKTDKSFHSLGGQILYKQRKNLTLESK
jgi:hypothetical protein